MKTETFQCTGDFVVDDGVGGYDDIGEEEDWTVDPEAGTEDGTILHEKKAGATDKESKGANSHHFLGH